MKRALILSGGGAKGAFTVGALGVMNREKPELTFDIMSGSSTGALIASLFIIDEITLLERIYLNVNNDHILLAQDPLRNIKKNQPFIFSDEPLTKLVGEVVTEAVAQRVINSPKTLLLTAINLQTGRITVFSNQSIPATANYDVIRIRTRDTLMKAMRASSNQAVFMPPVSISNDLGEEFQFIDGGNREVIPTLAVIDQNPTELYVLSNNPAQIFTVPEKYTSILSILERSIGIFIQDVRENDMAALNHWTKSEGRNVPVTRIDPLEDLDPDFPTGLRFNPRRMGDMMATGALRAREILGITTSTGRVLAPTGGAPRSAVKRVRKAATKKKAAKKASTRTATSNDSSVRCKAMTKAGKRCRNTAVRRGLCHVHT
jgi:NTE family protein